MEIRNDKQQTWKDKITMAVTEWTRLDSGLVTVIFQWPFPLPSDANLPFVDPYGLISFSAEA